MKIFKKHYNSYKKISESLCQQRGVFKDIDSVVKVRIYSEGMYVVLTKDELESALKHLSESNIK